MDERLQIMFARRSIREYTGQTYQKLLTDHGIRASMSRAVS